MREILFRAKKPISEEWVEGYFVKFYSNADAMPSHMIFAINEQGKNSELYDVDPETICQYTGLTDKNGRKIFEGDIINDIDYGIMKCIYLHGSFVWYKEDDFKIECMKYVPVIEVIGNIFDNHYLMDGSGTEIREGMDVYGLMLSADGYFAAEGIVIGTDQEGFRVKYKMLADIRYSYSDIGKNIYVDKETARSEAENAQYEAEKARREDFEEQNKRPFGKF